MNEGVWVYPGGEKGWRPMERAADGSTRPISRNDWGDYHWVAEAPDATDEERVFKRGPRLRDR